MSTSVQSLTGPQPPKVFETGISQGTAFEEFRKRPRKLAHRRSVGEGRELVQRLKSNHGDTKEADSTLVFQDGGMAPVAGLAAPPSVESAYERGLKLYMPSSATDHVDRGLSFLAESILRDLVVIVPEGGWNQWDVEAERERARLLSASQLESRAMGEVESAFLASDSSDESIKKFGAVIDDVVHRYGVEGVAAVGDWILRQSMPSDAAWCAIERLGIRVEGSTLENRRQVLMGLLNSTHAGVRYEAASALEFLVDDHVREVAKRHRDKEQVPSVNAALEILLSR